SGRGRIGLKNSALSRGNQRRQNGCSFGCRGFRRNGCGRSLSAGIAGPAETAVPATLTVTTFATALTRTTFTGPAFVAARTCIAGITGHLTAALEHFAFVNPALNTDHPIGGVRFGKTIIDVGPEGM